MRTRIAAVGVVLLVAAGAAWGEARPEVVLPFDHWAYDAIQKLVDCGFIVGYPDGTFRGNAAQTRGEFAGMVWQALGILDRKLPSDQSGPCAYMSRPEVAVILAKLVKEFWPEMDWLKDTEKPGAVRKRLAAVREGHWFHAWAQRLLQDEGQPAGALGYFPDVPARHWAAEAVGRVTAAGIMVGEPGGEFGGE